MQVVYISRTAGEAILVQGLLGDEGIEAVVRGAALAGVSGEVPADQAMPRVCVEDEDLAKAQSLIDEFTGRITLDAGPPWACASCGETHDPQFGACWRCGADRG